MQRKTIRINGSFFSDGSKEGNEKQKKDLEQHRNHALDVIANNPNSDITIKTVATIAPKKIMFTAGVSQDAIKQQLDEVLSMRQEEKLMPKQEDISNEDGHMSDSYCHLM